MSRGSLSHHSSRKLDACTLQLGNWNPFLPPSLAAASPDCPSGLSASRREAQWSACGPAGDDLGEKETRPDLGLKHQPAVKVCDLSRLNFTSQELESTGRAASIAAMKGFSTYHERIMEDVANGSHGASNSSDYEMVPSSLSLLSARGSGWNKRQKQLSRALARGLWRWREGSRARKRRRRAGTSRSGSSRSSDRTGQGSRMYASDPPTVGASATYATCSDFPVAGTDSSGELFYAGDVNGASWDPEFSSASDGTVHKRDGGGELQTGWLALDIQVPESGYGSEPGYRGDGELGYGEDGPLDEQDEEEKEPLQLCPWREMSVSEIRSNDIQERLSEHDIQERMADFESLDEDFVGELITARNTSDQKMHHRLRRRRQDSRILNGQKNKHV